MDRTLMADQRAGAIARDALVTVAAQHVSSNLGDEVVILDLNVGSYLGLEGAGARVWELLSEPRTVGEIQETLLREYDVEPGRCGRDIDALLQVLAKKGLVTITDERPL